MASVFRLVLVLVLLSSAVLNAAIPEGTSTESVEESSPWNKIGVDLYGWSYGSGIGRWDNRKPNADGSLGNPIEIINQVSIGYPTNIGMNFVVVPQFSVRPFVRDVDQTTFELKDPTFGIAGTLYESGGFNIWARFENALPLSQSSRDNRMVLNPGTQATFTYRFARSNWELQTSIYPSVSLMSNGDLASYFYFNPRVNYVLNDTWTVFTYLETATQTERAAGLFNFSSSQDTHVGVGMRYNFAGLFVEPTINMFPFDEASDSYRPFFALFFGGTLM